MKNGGDGGSGEVVEMKQWIGFGEACLLLGFLLSSGVKWEASTDLQERENGWFYLKSEALRVGCVEDKVHLQ